MSRPRRRPPRPPSASRDRDELVELMGRYASMADTGSWDELPRTVLHEQVTSDFSALGAPARTVTRDDWVMASRRAFAGWTATHHAITNHLVTVDGDRATLRAHVRVEHWAPPEVAAGGPDCWLVVGFYDVGAVRTAQGWRLSSVRLALTHQENAALLAATVSAAASPALD